MTRYAVVAALLLVAACGSADRGAEPNEADVQFATDMIEHHAQAIEMANYSIGREGLDPRVAKLAEQIRIGQTEEIDTLSDLLREWGEPVPETGFATGDGHTHEEDDAAAGAEDHAGMPGMMSATEMRRLAEAPRRQFDRMWIAMMIEHHHGAIAMAEEAQRAGQHDEIVTLARDIERAQAAETERLESWLDEM